MSNSPFNKVNLKGIFLICELMSYDAIFFHLKANFFNNKMPWDRLIPRELNRTGLRLLLTRSYIREDNIFYHKTRTISSELQSCSEN